jgi:multimeric flavodoxin WrbA
MLRVLVLYEEDAIARAPRMARAIAQGSQESGADVRLAPLSEAGVDDVKWADALALGIEGRDNGVPQAAKQWLDALGFAGWRVFRKKSSCVFATHPWDGRGAHTSCRALARLLDARGMYTSTAADLGIHAAESSATAIGRRLGTASPFFHPTARVGSHRPGMC